MPDETIIQSPFKPRARMLLQLGDQLIKNESVAIVELVKNGYDADASFVNITLSNIDDPESGEIKIEDDGWGMDLDIIVNCWLEPGSDAKSESVKTLNRSPKGRLPIGEKGIGRFGAHKLGKVIELTTKKEDGDEFVVNIDWEAFMHAKYLDDVPVIITKLEEPKHFRDGTHGTLIRISKLNKVWTRGDVRSIQRAINALSSPFESNDSFVTHVNCLGHEDWLWGMIDWKEIKKYAMYHFKVILEDDRIDYFCYEFLPWDSMTKLHSHKSEWFFDASSENITDSTNKILEEFKFLSLNGKDFSLSEDGTKIGKVVFEGYIFDRDAFVLKLGVADKKGFKDYLDNNGGISIYRDGLRVYDYGEQGNDWLNLDIRRVNQPGKKLSNNIILGSISLDRAESTSLVEKTNREGFIENKAYRLFRDAILCAINIVEALRYEDKTKIREFYGPTTKSEPVLKLVGDLKSYVDSKIKEEPVKKYINRYLVKIEEDYKLVCDNLLKAAGAGLNMSVIVHEVEKVIDEVSQILKSENASDRVKNLVKHLSSLIDGYANIIRRSEVREDSIIKVIDNALFNTEYRMRAHGVTVDKAYKKYTGTTKLKISKSLLIGAMMNIIDNSIYWMEHAKIQDKKFFVGIEEDQSYLKVIFADNGNGFLLPTDSIIKPFVSLKEDGIGLGLHIVSEILLAQKGVLSFPEFGDVNLPACYSTGAIICFSLKK